MTDHFNVQVRVQQVLSTAPGVNYRHHDTGEGKRIVVDLVSANVTAQTEDDAYVKAYKLLGAISPMQAPPVLQQVEALNQVRELTEQLETVRDLLRTREDALRAVQDAFEQAQQRNVRLEAELLELRSSRTGEEPSAS